MRTYTVHLPPDGDEARLDLAERTELVADGFSAFAFVLAPVWMLVNRLWRVLIGYIVGLVGLEVAMALLGVPELWQALLGFGVHLIIGFEADQLKRWTLHRKGYRMVAVVSGRDADEGVTRFLDAWLAKRSAAPLA